MSNLSFEKGLLKEHTPEPLEGYRVVVFERVGQAGERFHSVLPCGAPLAKARGILRAFQPQVHHFAVAVSAAPELHLTVRERVVMDDEAGHGFDLLLDLSCAAGDPRVLACYRSHDPLRRVCERVARVLARDVSRLDWTVVLCGFAATAQGLAEQRLPALREFAAELGIALHSVVPSRVLPDEISAPARRTEAELSRILHDGRIRSARGETERLVRDSENLWVLGGAEMDEAAQNVRDVARLRAAALEARARAIGQVADAVSTVEEYHVAFPGGAAHGGDGAQPGAPHPEPVPVPVPAQGVPGTTALSGPRERLGDLLHQLVVATRSIRQAARRREVRAALLHLVAEVQLEDLGDPAVVAGHAGCARQLLRTLGEGPLPREMDALRMLASPGHLRSSLEG